MARKKGPPIVEVVRKEAREKRLIDDRYKDPLKGVRAKEERRLNRKRSS